MQERRQDLAQVRRSSPEVTPTFVLKAERFQAFRDAGNDGKKRLAADLDRAVTEIIEKYQIVEGTLAGKLRDWIELFVRIYFVDKSLEAARVTPTQARKRWKRIEAAFQTLEKEIPIHCGLNYVFDRSDPLYLCTRTAGISAQLRDIHMYAEKMYEWRGHFRKHKANNAAKPALTRLSCSIRQAWVTDLQCVERIPSITAGSKYVQFAAYIYAFVGEPCATDRVTINRLRTVEVQEKTRAKSSS
jgi:hypothetical protein